MRATLVLGLLAVAAATPAPALAPGDPMPELTVEAWLQGESPDLRPWGDGHVYLVDLWGTWCLPCIKLMPALSDLQDELRDRGLVVLGYSWEEADVVRAFVAQRQDDVRYALVTDSQERLLQVLAEAEAVEGFPYVFLVDGAGIIRWKGPGQAAGQAVRRYFAAGGN
jgi:thiol-disulfide isomerase/thioredoxin